MNTNKKSKIIFYFLAFIILFVAGWFFLQSRSNKKDKDAEQNSVKSLSHVQVEDGMTTIELSLSERVNSGITTIKLIQTKHQAQLTAYGTVVSIQYLSKDVQSFETDKALLTKAKESLIISQKNYERVKSLYEKKLASEQDFQTAQAAFLSDQADVSSAQSDLSSLKSSILEQWGSEISKWIFNNTSSLQNLLELKEELIQISLTPDEMDIKTPGNISIQSPSGNKRIICRYISAGHLANSQFQTKTLYYIVSNTSLSGGMNVKAFLPVGKDLSGVIVPSESIVWYQSKAWIYVEKQQNEFIRVEVDTDNPFNNGFFVPGNHSEINPGATIVKNGAQLLLSEELTPAQSSGSGEGDND